MDNEFETLRQINDKSSIEIEHSKARLKAIDKQLHNESNMVSRSDLDTHVQKWQKDAFNVVCRLSGDFRLDSSIEREIGKYQGGSPIVLSLDQSTKAIDPIGSTALRERFLFSFRNEVVILCDA